MTPADPWTTHGITLRPSDRLSGSVDAFNGTLLAGSAFPVVVAQPDGRWYGRRSGEAAVRYGSRHEALAHIVRGCPDCICLPGPCETDDTGDHCAEMNCGYCLHGCSEDLCPVGEKANTR